MRVLENWELPCCADAPKSVGLNSRLLPATSGDPNRATLLVEDVSVTFWNVIVLPS